jgi:hypothetical protein
VRFEAFHLPALGGAPDLITLERADACAVALRLTPEDVRRICAALHTAHTQLARLPVARIIAAVDSAARRLRHPAAEGFNELIAGIAAFTGFSPPMAAHVLERISGDWLAAPLEQLVRVELGDAAAIDAFATRSGGGRIRAVGPPLTLHVFSGNVPGVSVTSIVRALLVKSAVLGKTAAGEPLLAPRFAQLLARADPVVGDAVAVTYWSGGDTALEEVALEQADTVVHYGGATAIESLRARAPGHVRFLEHGPRVAFAMVDGDIVGGDLGERAAHGLARAVATFDQQGCVSPQTAYVLAADQRPARHFAARVAAALALLQQELPRGRIEPAEAAAVRNLRTRAEFRSIAGHHVELWAGEPLAWTVVFDADAGFAGTCLNRTLLVKPAGSVDQVVAHVRPFGHLLQTVGVAGFDGDRLLTLATALADAGATRITSLADMPWPPPTWHHDGRGPLSELVRWVDLEI